MLTTNSLQGGPMPVFVRQCDQPCAFASLTKTARAVNAGCIRLRLEPRLGSRRSAFKRRLGALLLGLSMYLGFYPDFSNPASANPVLLLANQCESLPYAADFETAFTPAHLARHDAATLARRFERLTLGLNNISDQLSLYLAAPLPSDARELLLNCQIRLSDEFNRMLSSPAMGELVTKLQQAPGPASPRQRETIQLGNALASLVSQQLSLDDKARLHAAKAMLASSRKRADFSLSPPANCPPLRQPASAGQSKASSSSPEQQAASETKQQKSITSQVATYLATEPREECRKAVWQAWQSRDQAMVTNALTVIHQLRQQQASSQGYPNYAGFALAKEALAPLMLTPAEAYHFLTLTRPHAVPAPWNIATELKKLAGSRQSLDANSILNELIEASKAFGIEVEALSANDLRFWHHGRLLGDVLVNQQQTLDLSIQKRGVLGRQFSQLNLSLPATLKGRSDANRLIGLYAEALTHLAMSQSHALLTPPEESSSLASQWLGAILEQRLSANLPALTPREALAERYSLNQAYYRAALALDFYQAWPADTSHIKSPFTRYFAAEWSDTQAQYFSLGNALEDGPLGYRQLFTQQIANYVLTHAKLDDAATFALLLENPDKLSQSAQLALLLGDTFTADELINQLALQASLAWSQQSTNPSNSTTADNQSTAGNPTNPSTKTSNPSTQTSQRSNH